MERGTRGVSPVEWRFEREPEGVLRVTPGAGQPLFIAVVLLLLGLWFTLSLLVFAWRGQPDLAALVRDRSGQPMVAFFGFGVAAGLAITAVGAWHALGREYWRAGDNFFEVGRVFFGRPLSRRYLGASFILRDTTGGREGGTWQLGLRRKHRPRELAANGNLESALELAQLLVRYTGWPLIFSLWNSDGLVLNLKTRRYWRGRDPLELTPGNSGTFREFSQLRLRAAPPRTRRDPTAGPRELVLYLDWQEPGRKPSELLRFTEPGPAQRKAAWRQANLLAELLGLPVVAENESGVTRSGSA